jgi:hypothetical protein
MHLSERRAPCSSTKSGAADVPASRSQDGLTQERDVLAPRATA